MTDIRLRDEILDELTGNLLPFWRERALDDAGQFIGEMDAWGRVGTSASKGLILNARLLWTYSAFYRWSQDARDLELAHQAHNSLQTEFRDVNHGGYAWSLDANRQIDQPDKKIYGQAFCIYALSEYYRASGLAAARDAAVELYELIEKYAGDSAHGGYFEVCHADWSLAENQQLSAVDQDAPKSTNTHLHVLEAYTNLARAWPNTQLQGRLEDLLLIFTRRIISSERSHLDHFFERDWSPCAKEYTYGHDIEASWLLCEGAAVLDDPKRSKTIATTARRLARAAIDEGLGPDGGLFNEGRAGRPTDRSKIWWVQAEAVVGLLNASTITGDKQYLRAAQQVWQYIQQHVVDRQHGEWHWRLSPENRADLSLPKVSNWKGPYHNGRMCLEVLRRLEPEG